MVPQGGSSSMRRGRCSEMLWLDALCSRSGAQTVTSPSGASASASARSPGASTPSSLLTRIRTPCAVPAQRRHRNRTSGREGPLRPSRGRPQIGAVAESAEAPAAPLPLPRAPERIVELGSPVFGAWAGSVPDARFDGLNEEYPRGTVARRLVEKRWVYVLVPTREVMLAMALVDAGYLSSGFCAVLDRGSGKLLFDSSPVLPPLCRRVSDVPGAGLAGRLAGPRLKARFASSGRLHLAQSRRQCAAGACRTRVVT